MTGPSPAAGWRGGREEGGRFCGWRRAGCPAPPEGGALAWRPERAAAGNHPGSLKKNTHTCTHNCTHMYTNTQEICKKSGDRISLKKDIWTGRPQIHMDILEANQQCWAGELVMLLHATTLTAVCCANNNLSHEPQLHTFAAVTS